MSSFYFEKRLLKIFISLFVLTCVFLTAEEKKSTDQLKKSLGDYSGFSLPYLPSDWDTYKNDPAQLLGLFIIYDENDNPQIIGSKVHKELKDTFKIAPSKQVILSNKVNTTNDLDANIFFVGLKYSNNIAYEITLTEALIGTMSSEFINFSKFHDYDDISVGIPDKYKRIVWVRGFKILNRTSRLYQEHKLDMGFSYMVTISNKSYVSNEDIKIENFVLALTTDVSSQFGKKDSNNIFVKNLSLPKGNFIIDQKFNSLKIDKNLQTFFKDDTMK